MNWGSIYQTVEQAQQMQNMNFIPVNNFPQMNQMFNPMNMNQMNGPMDQIQLMANMFQNQNMSQMMMGGNPNFNNNNMNMNNMKKGPEKINLVFSTLYGARINMAFNSEETVDGALTKFLKRVNLDHLINNLGGKLNFILAAETLKFGDQRKLKNLIFMPSNFTTVLVHDTQNLIGAKL